MTAPAWKDHCQVCHLPVKYGGIQVAFESPTVTVRMFWGECCGIPWLAIAEDSPETPEYAPRAEGYRSTKVTDAELHELRTGWDLLDSRKAAS